MRPRIYQKWEIPKSVVLLVRALCADYTRRQIAIEKKTVDEKVLDEFVRINGAIDRALEDVETEVRRVILLDVVFGRGYNRSCAAMCMCEESFVKRKHKLIHDIAVELNLIA